MSTPASANAATIRSFVPFHDILFVQLIPPREDVIAEVAGWVAAVRGGLTVSWYSDREVWLPKPYPIHLETSDHTPILVARDSEDPVNQFAFARLGEKHEQDIGLLRASTLLMKWVTSPGAEKIAYQEQGRRTMHYSPIENQLLYVLEPQWNLRQWREFIKSLAELRDRACLARFRGIQGRATNALAKEVEGKYWRPQGVEAKAK